MLNKKKKVQRLGAGAVLVLLLFLAGSFHLTGFPAAWWDEGWTLSVARNWVEHGHYGRMLEGARSAPGLEAAFPVTALVAGSFKLLGVGIWQGRLVSVLCMIGSMGLMYLLALRLYNRRVALGTLFVILFMSPHPILHPFFIGHQVLAEMPMLFFLLCGFALFGLAVRKSPWYFGLVLIFWGLALNSKAQIVPFFALSLLVPLTVALSGRKKKMAIFFVLGLLGSFAISKLLLLLQGFLLAGHTLPAEQLQGMYEVLALVFTPDSRLFTIIFVLETGVPILIAFGYAACKRFPVFRHPREASDDEFLRLAWLTLAGSWLAWYVFLSIGFPRYMFPPMFLGSIFVAVLIADLTTNFNWRISLTHLTDAWKRRRLNQQSAALILSAILMGVAVPSTVSSLTYQYVKNFNISAMQTADYIHAHTSPDILIETYDSELHFLLNRKVHYPSDQVHVELNRQTFLGQDVRINYDPLARDPDVLVVGVQSRIWKLYDPVINSGAFRFMIRIGRYDIYQRVR